MTWSPQIFSSLPNSRSVPIDSSPTKRPPAPTDLDAPQSGMCSTQLRGRRFPDISSSGAGVIVRDSNGTCLAWRMRHFPLAIDPALAEARAALESLCLASARGWRNIIIESDCKLVISRLLSPAEDFSTLGPILCDARRLMGGFDSCSTMFIPRLAKWGCPLSC
ncbi:hypothetical protein Salat_1708800 [Sesamum alatum]|uniref:RNase H type-1 domain-containing protein n=1 Tax=Sesamum alatum TaxID=300844 RepID=A0AAE2CKC3_9LAMI|nr:hypothetical protein Salat_1708800 [Sesamum alatum]